MSNVIIASPHLSDAATISGSEAVGDMSLLNLKAKNLYKKYRTTNLSAQINIDLGSAQSIDFAAIVCHNATAAGKVTIKAGSTSAVSDYNSSALDLITGDDLGFEKNAFASKFSSQNYRYWRFDFSDGSNPDSYLEMGRIYLSNAFQPSKNASWGLSEGYADDSRTRKTVAGGLSSVNRDPYKTASFQLDFGTAAEMYLQAREIDRLRGLSKDIIFIPDIADTAYFQERFIYGKMTSMPPVILDFYNIYRKAYEIEEIR